MFHTGLQLKHLEQVAMFHLVVGRAFFQPGLAVMWVKHGAIHDGEHGNQINTCRGLKSQHWRPRCKLPLKDTHMGELSNTFIYLTYI